MTTISNPTNINGSVSMESLHCSAPVDGYVNFSGSFKCTPAAGGDANTGFDFTVTDNAAGFANRGDCSGVGVAWFGKIVAEVYAGPNGIVRVRWQSPDTNLNTWSFTGQYKAS